MLDEFATISSGQSLFDFGDQPRVVVQKTLDRFFHKRLRLVTLFGSEAGQFGLKIETQIQFHMPPR